MQTPLQALAEAEIRNSNSLHAARRVVEAEAGIRTDDDRAAIRSYAREMVAHIKAGGSLMDDDAPKRDR